MGREQEHRTSLLTQTRRWTLARAPAHCQAPTREALTIRSSWIGSAPTLHKTKRCLDGLMCAVGDSEVQAPAVAPYDTVGHAQGYRKSTGQRTQGNDQFFGDERTSCSTVADVTGFKPACLVHSYDQPPAIKWGSHALQVGALHSSIDQSHVVIACVCAGRSSSHHHPERANTKLAS